MWVISFSKIPQKYMALFQLVCTLINQKNSHTYTSLYSSNFTDKYTKIQRKILHVFWRMNDSLPACFVSMHLSLKISFHLKNKKTGVFPPVFLFKHG
jgi:hypothetical protein